MPAAEVNGRAQSVGRRCGMLASQGAPVPEEYAGNYSLEVNPGDPTLVLPLTNAICAR